MKKTVLEIYTMAVCFITVVCFVISLGFGIYGAIGIFSPEFTMNSYVYMQHQTNDDFWGGGGPMGLPPPPIFPESNVKAPERPSEPELTKKREASYVRAIANERRDNVQNVVKALIVIFIDSAVFGFHWFIARRVRETAT